MQPGTAVCCSSHDHFVEPACGELNIIATIVAWCMSVSECVRNSCKWNSFIPEFIFLHCWWEFHVTFPTVLDPICRCVWRKFVLTFSVCELWPFDTFHCIDLYWKNPHKCNSSYTSGGNFLKLSHNA